MSIADVHGDVEGLVSALKAAGLVDKDVEWTGGDAVLVQTGDVFDRGPDSLRAHELLVKLAA